MADGLTLDSGALIATEKGSEEVWALMKAAVADRAIVTVPSPVLTQVWRGNHPRIARLLKGCVIEPLDERAAQRAGVLLGTSRTRDVVDAVVVAGAAARGDAIVTSDPGDMERLVECTRRPVSIVALS